MNYNPFAEKYTALEKEIIIAKERLREQTDSLKWYTSFDLGKATSV
jgi:hypothetical protein